MRPCACGRLCAGSSITRTLSARDPGAVLLRRFIEVVLDSNTCAGIITEMTGGMMGVWDKDAYERWLRKKNPDEVGFDKALANFVDSCAGSCVATNVLGIGDTSLLSAYTPVAAAAQKFPRRRRPCSCGGLDCLDYVHVAGRSDRYRSQVTGTTTT